MSVLNERGSTRCVESSWHWSAPKCHQNQDSLGRREVVSKAVAPRRWEVVQGYFEEGVLFAQRSVIANEVRNNTQAVARGEGGPPTRKS